MEGNGAKILDLTDDTFDEAVQPSNGPILVDFWAPWCGPCKMILPALAELSNELDGRVRIAKLNVEENMDIPGRFGIRHIPALLMFKDGKRVDEHIGVASKSEIRGMIEKAVRG